MRRYYLILSAVLGLLLLPLIWWQVQAPMDVSVAVIDLTVPNETYREHQGIHWLLNYLKIPNTNGARFQLAQDYYGVVPNEADKSYAMNDLPTDFTAYDVVYLADTYGVFQDDMPWQETERDGDFSEKLYGGLNYQQWQPMRARFLDEEPSVLVAEFNSFASPTERAMQLEMTDFMGLDWQGWVGRYFDELSFDINEELPQWLLSEYGSDWPYSGPGLILVNDFNQELLVLEADKHLTGQGVSLNYSQVGRDYFNLDESTDYTYWFDIITAKAGTEVLAHYDLNLSDEGEALLNQAGIPLESAAVTRKVSPQHTSYYFAGDYNDITALPKFQQVKGLSLFNKWQAQLTNGHFYWSAFVPMMEKILADTESGVGASMLSLEGAELSVTPPDEKAEGNLEGNTDGKAEENNMNEVAYTFRVTGPQFEVLVDDVWQAITIKGVNMGMANPGHYPGQAGITEAEYARWFEMIGQMNANTIRVYTIHPPGFYRALKAYNESHDHPLYVFHGIWKNEEEMVSSQDVFETNNLTHFQEEIRRVVDLTHGNLRIEPQAGHASGVYDADVSEYIIGWMVGTEWDPQVVVGTNEKHSEIGDYSGTYFRTEGASPFEHFLAAQMDLMMTYEMDHYQTHRPMSFTNWVTTDLLNHPTESSREEDLVSVNPNVIHIQGEAEKTGQFASYHVYPYYPDFLNYTAKYNQYIDHRGQPNSYAGYLNELHQAHDMPVLIAEFGIPASRGRTHENPFGRHQGGLSEEEQGLIVEAMFEEIIEEGMLGGLVFTWQDEWFKRTWNTMDYDNPDQRPFWSNAQTNEQQFGLLSFDRHKIRVNGDVNDWLGHSSPLLEVTDEPIRSLYVDHDERYLYIRVDYDPTSIGYPVLTFDTVPGQGNETITDLSGVQLSHGAEFMVDLSQEARVLVDAYYDFFTIQYGLGLGLLGPNIATPVKNSGAFTPIQFTLNKEYFVIDEGVTLPFAAYETGRLKEGNGDPDSPDYDSLADYFVDRDQGILELRLPWLLLSSKDPSKKEFQGDLMADGLEASVLIDEIGVGALWAKENQVLYQSPVVAYSWEDWDLPLSLERLKQSYYILQETFKRYE